MQRPAKNPISGLHEIDIDGQTFAFTEWPLRLWLDRYAMLMGIAGEFLARVAEAQLTKREADRALFGELAETLMRNIGKDRATSLALIESLCSDLVFVDGKKVNFALEFNHKHFKLHRVCGAAVAVQFGPLLEEAMAYGKSRDSQSPNETNLSGESGPSSTPG